MPSNNDILIPTTPIEPPSATETLEELFSGVRRPHASIRAEFLQGPGAGRKPGAPGPLHLFVLGRQHFALELYLLAHQLALGGDYDFPALPAGAVARALGKSGPGGEASVSRAWSWLESQNLISKKREGSLLRVNLLRENGSKEARPKPTYPFFQLSKRFFLDGYHERLSLPATAVLLIALNRSFRSEWWTLPAEPSSVFYGISPETIRRGLDELRDKQIAEVRLITKRDARSRFGVVRLNEYRLLHPFERSDRPAPKKKPNDAAEGGDADAGSQE